MLGSIPLEIALLAKLKHSNIVKVIRHVPLVFAYCTSLKKQATLKLPIKFANCICFWQSNADDLK